MLFSKDAWKYTKKGIGLFIPEWMKSKKGAAFTLGSTALAAIPTFMYARKKRIEQQKLKKKFGLLDENFYPKQVQ